MKRPIVRPSVCLSHRSTAAVACDGFAAEHPACTTYHAMAGEWSACWTQAQKARVQIAAATLSGNSLRQTVHTHHASVHQAAELVAALLSVVRVTAGLVESNGSLPPGL